MQVLIQPNHQHLVIASDQLEEGADMQAMLQPYQQHLLPGGEQLEEGAGMLAMIQPDQQHLPHHMGASSTRRAQTCCR